MKMPETVLTPAQRKRADAKFQKAVEQGKRRQFVSLTLTRPNGHRSTAKIKGPGVNDNMLAAAEELIYTIMTGERFEPAKPKPKKAKR